jgi:hypothetical protein
MGYYVNIEDTNFFLDKKHFEDVYKKMCELNNYDALKRGGSFGTNNDLVEGEKYNRNAWFSWMEYNYPDIYSDMNSILIALGFETEYDEDGNLINLNYSDKTGSEDYFLSCFAGFVKDGSFIQWKGEENEDYYRHSFKDGKMIAQKAVMVLTYSEDDSDVYEFGKLSQSDEALAQWSKEYREKLALEKAEKEALENSND